MVEKTDFGPRKLCEQQPLNVQRQCLLVAKSMKASRSVKDLLEGCTDTTGHYDPQLQDDNKPIITESNGVRATPCPGVIACNILEAHSGAPMCGIKLRGWGDYFYEKSIGNPIRPSMMDTWPSDGYDTSLNGGPTSINFAPPPWSSITTNSADNIDCDLCVDTFTMMSLKYPHPSETSGGRRRRLLQAEPPTKSLLCMNQPISMLPTCTRFVNAFTKNVDVTKILVDGCIDKTTNEIMQTESNGCSAEVACNVIRSNVGGPYCGRSLREVGDLTGQPAVRFQSVVFFLFFVVVVEIVLLCSSFLIFFNFLKPQLTKNNQPTHNCCCYLTSQNHNWNLRAQPLQ